jgi:hypothetical protein
MAEAGFAWFAGIDWGSERHQACLVDVQESIVAEREFGITVRVWRSWVIGCCRPPGGTCRCGSVRSAARTGCRFVG